MASLHYLTVQDILWINLQVTKKVHHFSYARLEEATYYQYAYGESNSLTPQAGRFVTGFMKMHPFEAGNEATAFVGCLAFLRINGADVDLTDEQARAWFEKIRLRETTGAEAIAPKVKQEEDYHPTLKPDVRTFVRGVLADYPCTILHLTETAATAGA